MNRAMMALSISARSTKYFSWIIFLSLIKCNYNPSICQVLTSSRNSHVTIEIYDITYSRDIYVDSDIDARLSRLVDRAVALVFMHCYLSIQNLDWEFKIASLFVFMNSTYT